MKPLKERINITKDCFHVVVSAVITANGLRLGEGGDFQHKLSYEALKFI
jgi:hypothetical protein